MSCNKLIMNGNGTMSPCRSFNSVLNGVDYKECINQQCTHSKRLPHFISMHKLISKIFITADCSADMARKIESYDVRPSIFRIDTKVRGEVCKGQWQKVLV